MKRIIGIIISIGIIIAGLSGEFVLRGTNSSIALVVAGVIFLIIDIIGLIRDNTNNQVSQMPDNNSADENPEPETAISNKDWNEIEQWAHAGSEDLITQLNDENYYEAIADNPCMVVCFYEQRGLPSSRVVSILQELAAEYAGRVKVGLYDVYAAGCESVRASNEITSLPTVLFFKDGQEVNKRIGTAQKDYFKNCFDQLLIP